MHHIAPAIPHTGNGQEYWQVKCENVVLQLDMTVGVMHLSMLILRGGGGGPRAHVGHLTSIAFPTFGNLIKNLGPRVGMFAFLHGGMRPSHIVPCAHLGIEVAYICS